MVRWTDHGWFDFDIEIFQCIDCLHDDWTSFFFWNGFVLLEKEIQIISIAMFQDGTEWIRIDFEDIEQFDNA